MLREPTPLEIQVQALKAKLAPEQTVRILVKLKEPIPESRANDEASGSPTLAPSLPEAQARFLEGIQGPEVVSAKALTGTPLVLLVITKEGLDRLLSIDMVERIQEDQPQKPFGGR